MSDIRLTTPEGYFDTSLEKTLASVRKIQRRRKRVIYCCAAFVLTVGTCLSILSVRVDRDGKEYLAQQAEMAELDIFLEINR